MSESDSQLAGLLASLRRIGDSIMGLAQSRLQLIALELESEKLRLMRILLWLIFAVALGAMGLMVGTAALATYLWETAGYAGLLLAAGALVGAAWLIVWRLREGIRKSPAPLAETIAEFRKDRACLQGKG
jgi:uncharacterized membrane protein YqjE